VATHILDLLSAVDVELETGESGVGDLTACLHSCGRIIRELVATGVDMRARSGRRTAALEMANLCIAASGVWPAEAARCAQLVGALGDVIGRLYDELTQSDRWATVIALSSVARRCARLIAASGPYQHVAELNAVIEAAARLRRVAELSPPDPARCIGLTRPVPVLGLPSGLAPAQVVYERMAEILDLVNRRRGRGPVPLRQLAAVCRAAEAVAGAVQPPSSGRKASASAADAWHAGRDRLSRLTDGSHTAVANDRLSLCAARVVQAADLVPAVGSPDLDHADRAALERAAALLPALANALDRELRLVTQPPIGLVADRPLHEGRVNEWLHRRSFVASREDIAACRAPVTAARKRSEEFRIPFELSL
jgi:hypothetical protein